MKERNRERKYWGDEGGDEGEEKGRDKGGDRTLCRSARRLRFFSEPMFLLYSIALFIYVLHDSMWLNFI